MVRNDCTVKTLLWQQTVFKSDFRVSEEECSQAFQTFSGELTDLLKEPVRGIMGHSTVKVRYKMFTQLLYICYVQVAIWYKL